MSDTTSNIRPDYAASIAFLRRFHPGRLWALTAIHPDKNFKPRTVTATYDEKHEAECVKWLEDNGATYNLYFSVAEPTQAVSKKCERTDIARVWYHHVDVDPRTGEPLDDEQRRILALLSGTRRPEVIPGKIPAPPILTYSGGGYQGFWPLETPIEIGGDLDRAEDAKLYNLAIELALGADNCHNIDRVMRLPGTINRPDAKKIEKGRTEALATVVHYRDEKFSLDRFSKAAVKPKGDNAYGDMQGVGLPVNSGGSQAPYVCNATVERLNSIDDLPKKLRKWVKTMILKGYDAAAPDREIVKGFNDEKSKQGIAPTGKPYPSRSEATYATIGYCKFAGVTDGILLNILTDDRWQISAHCRDNRGESYARKQIENWRHDRPDFTERRATGADEPPSDTILDEGGKLLQSIAAMEVVLLTQGRPIYQRGEFLVRPATIGAIENGEPIDGVVETTKDGEKVVRDGGVERTVGAPTIRRVSTAWVQREVATHSNWCKRGSKGFIPIDPPLHIASHILDKVGEWRFPLLNGIICTPTIHPDGSLLDTPGYDPLTGLLLDTTGAIFPPVPQQPTIDDARAALDMLKAPYRAYIFAPNGSQSVLLAALLTAIYRPMMQHAPMFCFDASDPGSGKGKLAKCVGMMALGRRPAHMNLDPRDTEFITHFSAVLLAGDPVVWIDNISRPIGGIDVLDSAITDAMTRPLLPIRHYAQRGLWSLSGLPCGLC